MTDEKPIEDRLVSLAEDMFPRRDWRNLGTTEWLFIAKAFCKEEVEAERAASAVKQKERMKKAWEACQNATRTWDALPDYEESFEDWYEREEKNENNVNDTSS